MKRRKSLRKSLAVLLGTVAVLLAVSVAFGATLAEIKARGTLNLGLEDEDWGRFHMWKNNTASGFDVDLAEKIAAAAGVSLKIVPLPWGDGDAGSVSGAWSPGGWPPFDVDLILSGVTITPERAAYVTFSEPYFTSGQMVLFRKAAPITDAAALAGKKLGVQQATTSESVARERFGSSTIFIFAAVPEMLDALRAGALDAILLDSPFALTEAKEDASLAVLEELFSSEEFGVVLPKDVDPALKALVDEVVRQEKDALCEKWFK
ncbi:substrate-binding periplasmic protein [Aminiphilus circumscriptus]|uniref:substrate-binding periplasmic protein n=1 Tax=Aminiphilus circumscriptus TaxID=290732 RepID=UPI000470CCEC|nr:ABC transporter substrate-binding protein [Aminiphilus circumscriptus]